MKRLTNLFILIAFAAAPAMAQMSAGSTWVFDQTHSNLGFSVTHLVISEVDGSFGAYEGTVTTKGEDFSGAQVSFSIDVTSINTDNEQRDGHLKSPDFFDAAQYPTITFESTSFTLIDGNKYALKGNLTMHGVTREVTLDVRYLGTAVDPYGNTKAGFKITGELDRTEYGLTWDATTEAGGLVVSHEVTLDINAQLLKK